MQTCHPGYSGGLRHKARWLTANLGSVRMSSRRKGGWGGGSTPESRRGVAWRGPDCRTQYGKEGGRARGRKEPRGSTASSAGGKAGEEGAVLPGQCAAS